MKNGSKEICMIAALLAVTFVCLSCSGKSTGSASGEDPKVTTLGTIEVTARLVEIPQGAIFKKDLYNYATILKYQVIKVHRGQVNGDTIYVGHYNPWKPRGEAVDFCCPGYGTPAAVARARLTHNLASQAGRVDFVPVRLIWQDNERLAFDIQRHRLGGQTDGVRRFDALCLIPSIRAAN